MSGNPAILEQLQRLAPDIARCAGATNDPFEDLVEKALKYDCKKIQLFQPHFAKNEPDYVKKAIDKAHENGIVVNVFYADTYEDAKHYLDLGADVILTNDYQRVACAADNHPKYLIIK
jgi:glycerophosphoryl diester phosphodiesterase